METASTEIDTYVHTLPLHAARRIFTASGPATDGFRDALAQPAPAVPDLPFPEDYPDEYRMRRRECGLQLYDADGVAPGDRAASGAQAARHFVRFDAQHVAIVTSRRELGGDRRRDVEGRDVSGRVEIGGRQIV